MKWQTFRDPTTGATWREPVYDDTPKVEAPLSPELIAERDRLAQQTADLIADMKKVLGD